jgi:hypothetical protein
LAPRCTVPDWFWDLHDTARSELVEVRTAVDDFDRHAAQAAERLAAIGDKLREIAPRCEPHEHAIAGVRTDLDRAEQRQRAATRQLADSGPLHRRAGRAAVAAAADDVATARTALDELTRRAQPLLDERDTLHTERDRLHDHLTSALPSARRLERTDVTLTEAEHLVAALDTWRDWATGETIPPKQLITTARILNEVDVHHTALAKPLTEWIDRHHIAPTHAIRPQHHLHRPEPRFEPPGLDIGM